MDFRVADEVRAALEDAMRKRGKVNLVIAGRSGVGKSTLVNAVFQSKLAETGQGRPITTNVREYTKQGVPVTILDTRGLELADYEQTVRALRDEVDARRLDPDPQRHVHVAWVCIAEDSRRVEEGESAVVDMLARSVPTIAVVTKARADQGFQQTVQDLLPKVRNVVRVRALREELDDGHVLETMGLDTLVDVTMEVAPEGQKDAVAAAQRVSLRHKKRAAQKVVVGAAAAATATGATPIPFSDAVLLVPIQVGMLAGITAAFGVPLDEAFLTTLVSSAVGVLGASYVGRALAGSLLKLIPGGGSIAGGAIGGVTAAAITTAMGHLYISVLAELFDPRRDGPVSQDEVLKRWTRALKRKRDER